MTIQHGLFGEDVEYLDKLRNPVLTAKVGLNAPLFADICRLYLKDGSRVLDMTFGLGNFWDVRGLKERYDLVTMDLERPTIVRAALEVVPFKPETFAGVVLDPPYGNQGGGHDNDDTHVGVTYNLQKGTTLRIVREMYRAGLLEAARCLQVGGVAIVKCQDAMESRQCWIHLDVLRYAQDAGLIAEDLFVLVQGSPPIMRHNYQLHARKNHSYFWVFRKASDKR